MSDELEEWRAVVGWEGLYEVSSRGRVRSLDRVVVHSGRGCAAVTRHLKGRLLRLSTNRHGYLVGLLSRDGAAKNFEAHRLVCEAFHGIGRAGLQVAHEDGDRANAAANNLRWTTAAGNCADRLTHGTHPAGEHNGRAKLTMKQVAAIRSSVGPAASVAAQYGIGRSQVLRIRRGEAWGSALPLATPKSIT